MKTAPAMPPPSPPRDGNIATGADDWHDNPNAQRQGKWLRYGRILGKLVLLILLGLAAGQLGLILFQIVRLGLFS